MSAPLKAQPEWMLWALLSATFAALTAIFAKLGLEGIDSDHSNVDMRSNIMSVRISPPRVVKGGVQ